MRSPRDQAGQSTVEFVLCLPFVALLLASIVEIGCLVADQSRLLHAAREAARVGVVDADLDRIESAAERVGLTPLDVRVTPEEPLRRQGDPLVVELRYQPSARLKLLEPVLANVGLRAEAAMRIEQP